MLLDEVGVDARERLPGDCEYLEELLDCDALERPPFGRGERLLPPSLLDGCLVEGDQEDDCLLDEGEGEGEHHL